MTTYFQFLPNNRQAQSFMPTFDGVLYNVTIYWNISAQRYYVNCKDISGNLIFMVPLVGNMPPFQILSLSYDEFNQRVLAQIDIQYYMRIGRVIQANVINCVPQQYNGSGFLYLLSKDYLFYPMSTNPGPASVLGVVEYYISLTKGYFQSTMIYRNGYFEVNP
jgi:hypothetical protein